MLCVLILYIRGGANNLKVSIGYVIVKMQVIAQKKKKKASCRPKKKKKKNASYRPKKKKKKFKLSSKKM